MPPAINLGRAGRQPRMYDCRSALPRPAVGSGSAPCGGPTRTDSVEPPATTVCWPQGKEASSMHADDEAATRTTGSLRSCGRHRSISCERGCSTPRRRDARSGRRVVRSACPSQDVALPPWLAQPFLHNVPSSARPSVEGMSAALPSSWSTCAPQLRLVSSHCSNPSARWRPVGLRC